MGIRRPEESKVLIERLDIHCRSHELSREDGLYLGSKDERIAGAGFCFDLAVVKRLDSHAVARQRQPSLLIVPNRERKHSVQTRQALRTPLGKRRQQHFSVCFTAKSMTFALKFFAQLSIVINLSAKSDDVASLSR